MKNNYDPNALYVVTDGNRISIPDGNGGKRFVAYDVDVDEQGNKTPFTMSHRTAREVQYLVEVKKVIQPAPKAVETATTNTNVNKGGSKS